MVTGLGLSTTLIAAFRDLKPVRTLVVGDFILDVYTKGKVSRISPEAPVPILLVQEQHSLPGGAGNVILNLKVLGAEIKAFGRIGDDHNGKVLKELIFSRGVGVEGLLVQENYQTPAKNRFLADSQQLIRIDFEKSVPLDALIEKKIIADLTRAINKCDIIAISDYGKGLLSDEILSHVISLGKKKGIPVIVDPKGDRFQKYSGATMIKPNEKEAYEAAKCSSTATIEEVAQNIFDRVDVDMLLITRSEKGMAFFDRNGKEEYFPVIQKDVKDVTGAGDTALAMITFALANKMRIDHVVKLANIASGIAIEKVGCVSVTLSEIAARLLELDVEGKIFDEKNFFVLHQALSGKKVIVLHFDDQKELTQELFYTIRDISQSKKESKLIIYLSVPRENDKHFVTILSSLADIDFIVIQSDSLENFCTLIAPAKVYHIDKKGSISEHVYTSV
jgi:D-beta-D-heptose 7-phosphate kinase/D-beta-D-heptose 1-phosphate adenosyltransferase